MDVIYGLIPGMILLGLIAVGVFFWAARSGQFDDLEGEASRILMDDDDPPAGGRKAGGGTAEKDPSAPASGDGPDA